MISLPSITPEDVQAWRVVFPIIRVFFSQRIHTLTIVFKKKKPKVTSEEMESLISRYIFLPRRKDGLYLRGTHLNFLRQSVSENEVSILIPDITAKDVASAKISIFDGEKVRRKKVEIID